jgi:hypothetical protein
MGSYGSGGVNVYSPTMMGSMPSFLPIWMICCWYMCDCLEGEQVGRSVNVVWK